MSLVQKSKQFVSSNFKGQPPVIMNVISNDLRLHNTFEGVLLEKIRTRVVLK